MRNPEPKKAGHLLAKMAEPSDTSQQVLTSSGRGLTPISTYTGGYHTPDLAITPSPSPGSPGSYHTANPIDSERSSLNGYSEAEEGRGGMVHMQPEEEDTDVTLCSNSGPHHSLEVDRGRNWIDQPKLLVADSEEVRPCPEKRPLRDGQAEQRVPRPAVGEGNSPTHETTPLLQPPSQSDNGCKCCVIL